ncbi:MAG TPA: hypothetical protein VJS68_03300 [Thermoplasmata archaeon]|nr:hypothetical protein [Thermoplasmata archaeon]
MANVVIVARNEETRLLLKGLLRLHRHRVIGEAFTLEQAESLVGGSAPALLLVDAEADTEEWASLRKSIEIHPGLKAILITPSRSKSGEDRAREAGFDALVRRPFAVRELIDAVGRLFPPAPPSASSSGSLPGAPAPA